MASPEVLQRRRRGVLEVVERLPGALGDPAEQLGPEVAHSRVDRVHPGIRDEPHGQEVVRYLTEMGYHVEREGQGLWPV